MAQSLTTTTWSYGLGLYENCDVDLRLEFPIILYRNVQVMEMFFDFVGEAPFDHSVDGTVELVMSQMDTILTPINIAVWGQE